MAASVGAQDISIISGVVAGALSAMVIGDQIHTGSEDPIDDVIPGCRTFHSSVC